MRDKPQKEAKKPAHKLGEVEAIQPYSVEMEENKEYHLIRRGEE